MVLIGEFAALGGALLWAISATLFRKVGERVPPRELNLIKGVVALGLMSLTGLALREPFPLAQPGAMEMLLLSGALGIGLGDTAYFQSLNDLGAHRGLLMGLLAPPMAALIAWGALGEVLPARAWAGIAATAAGVAWVITERAHRTSSQEGGALLRGAAAGLLSSLAQAVGAVLSRAALAGTGVSALWSAALRLAAGVTVLVAWQVLARQPLGRWRAGASARQVWAPMGAAIFLGTFLGIWLQQVALQWASTGVAQTLLATSPLFVLPLAAWSGERVSLRAILGVVVALGGVALLFAGG